MWSFSSKDYRGLRGDRPHTNSFMAFLHSLNYWDFIRDTAAAIAFFFNYARHKPHTRTAEQVDFDHAFGVGGTPSASSSSNEMGVYGQRPMEQANGPDLNPRVRGGKGSDAY